jgi:5'-nucleotidase
MMNGANHFLSGHRTGVRMTRSLIYVGLLCAFLDMGVAGAADVASVACPDHPLRILLVNDDGYTAPGIRALRVALKDAGYDVKLVAPSTDFSGAGASITVGHPVTMSKVGDAAEIYFVDGSPATAVLLAADTLYEAKDPPDLVVSGINAGANLGVAVTSSGTVGATLAALTLLEHPVPGIAVSTDLPDRRGPASPANLDHYTDVARFTASFIKGLEQTACARHESLPVPAGIALNVNVPPSPVKAVKGVRVVKPQSRSPYQLHFEAVAGTKDQYRMRIATRVIEGDPMVDEFSAFEHDYITVVPYEARLVISERVRLRLIQDLSRAAP